MKNGPLKGEASCKYMPMIMERFTHCTDEKESSLYGKKNLGEIGESRDQLSESESDS